MPDSPILSELAKARILALDSHGNLIDVIPIRFNPTEYSLDKNINYAEQTMPGFTSPVTQFVSGDAETLSMELFVDSSEEHTDVRVFTSRIDNLLDINSDLHAPPICRFVWGTLIFKCTLQSATKQFTRFLPGGIPVRARVNVTFKEYKTPKEQKAERPRLSADKTNTWRVTESDTLWLIAWEEYRDPEQWRTIAKANDIENPRTLQAGTELVLPPLES